MSEAAGALSGGNQNILVQILLWFAKNPMSIFALLYMWKYAKRQWNEANGIEDDDADDEGDVPPTEGESEFWIVPQLARLLNFDFSIEGIVCMDFAQSGITPIIKFA